MKARMLLLLLSIAVGSANADDPPLVLTSTAPLYSITATLTSGTGIVVRNIPDRPRTLLTQPSYFKSRAERHREDFAAAAAVVGMAGLWTVDPLYTAARAANIRVIPIDATRYLSATAEGIAIARVPGSDDEPSPYFWLSINNTVRAADIVASDLIQLFPAAAEQIEINRRTFRTGLLSLKNRFDARFAALENTAVVALADEFVYTTSEMTLFVDRYDVRQDKDWSDADLQTLEAELREAGVTVVIHKWQPEARIAKAVAAGGARLVVLDRGESGHLVDGQLRADGLPMTLGNNLELLYDALAGP